MIKGRDEKPARPAGGIDDLFPWLRVENRDHHPNHIARSKQLPLVSAKSRTYEDLERIAHGIAVRVSHTVVLELANYVDDAIWVKFDGVVCREYIGEDFLFDLLEQVENPPFYGFWAFADASAKVHYVVERSFVLVVNFAEQ